MQDSISAIRPIVADAQDLRQRIEKRMDELGVMGAQRDAIIKEEMRFLKETTPLRKELESLLNRYRNAAPAQVPSEAVRRAIELTKKVERLRKLICVTQ